MFVLTLYVGYFSRYLGTYIHTLYILTYRNTYIQKVSFYNIENATVIGLLNFFTIILWPRTPLVKKSVTMANK